MPSVIILLSTYNGERYLEEQLHSLIHQEGVEYDIMVRDDGSTDGTPAILQRWQEKGLLSWYQGKNVGWAQSFMHLLCHAPQADYYAFCDHDDIWMSEKLAVAVSELESIKDSIKLYCSNLFSYKNSHNEGVVYKQPPVINIQTAMVKAATAGCTMVFSRALQQSIAQHPPHFLFAHDYWTYQVAVALGTVIYDPEPHILYRQHENNQIGYKKSFREVWGRRLKNLRTILSQHDRERAAQELIVCHGHEMEAEKRQAVEKVARYRQSLFRRFALMADGRYSMGHLSNNVWLRLRMLMGCM